MGKILLIVALLAAQMPSGDRSQITVKRTELNNGVVIVTALEGKTSLELQCNNGVPSCTALIRGLHDGAVAEEPRDVRLRQRRDLSQVW
jgi:hypothetical protein